MAKITLESICKDIVLAQVGSDAGKEIDKLACIARTSCLDKAYEYKYNDKSFYLLRAIQQVYNSKFLGVRYYVSNDKEFKGCIVYFQVTLPGHKSMQVSFHTPHWDKRVEEIRKYVNKTRPIRWDKKSSRETCFHIIKYFNW